MKKIIFYISLVVLTMNPAFSKISLQFKGQFLLDTTLIIQNKIISPQIHNNKLYFIYFRDKNNIELWEYQNNYEKHKIKLPSISTNYNIIDFVIVDTLLFIADFHNLFVYNYRDDNYNLINSLYIDYGITELKYTGNKLFVISNVIKPTNLASDINVIQINLSNYKMTVLSFPSPEGIEFSIILPRKIIDCNNELIAIASPTEYIIKFYNSDDGSFVSQLNNYNLLWKKYENKLPDSIWRKRPSKFFGSVVSKLDSFNTIQSINFVDSLHIVVVWNSINNNNLPIEIWDYWIKENTSWKLNNSEKFLKSYVSNDNYKIDNYKHFNFKNKANNFFLLLDFPVEYKKFLDKPIKILNNSIEKYYLENNPRFSLFWWQLYEN